MDQVVKFKIVDVDLDGISQSSFPGDNGKVNYWECAADVEYSGGSAGQATIRAYKHEQIKSLEAGQVLSGKLHDYKGVTRLTLTKATAGEATSARPQEKQSDNRSGEINGSVAFKAAVDICIASGQPTPKSIRAWTKELLVVLHEAQTGKLKVESEKESDDVPF